MNVGRWVAVATGALLAVACARQPSPEPAAPSAAPARTGTVMTRVTVSDHFTPRSGAAALQAFVPDIAAVDSGGECSVIRTSGSGATIVNAAFPSRAASHMSVSISFDSAGHLIRYSERRGEPIRLTGMGGKTDAERDSAMAAQIRAHRETTVSLDYAIDQAVVTNQGGGRPTQAVIGTARTVEGLEALGAPTARLKRVRALCGV